MDINYHVKVSQTPAESKRMKEESFWGIPQGNSAHIKHQQDPKRSVMCDIKFKQNSKKRCGMGTGQNKACDFTFLGYMHEQVM